MNWRVENQIERVLATRGICRKTYTRTYRGANEDMDHFLVMTKMRGLKDAKNTRIFNIKSLRTEKIRKQYEEKLQNTSKTTHSFYQISRIVGKKQKTL